MSDENSLFEFSLPGQTEGGREGEKVVILSEAKDLRLLQKMSARCQQSEILHCVRNDNPAGAVPAFREKNRWG
jgi:hypothetical protein